MSCDLCYGIYHCPVCGNGDEEDNLDELLDEADEYNDTINDLNRLENEQID